MKSLWKKIVGVLGLILAIFIGTKLSRAEKIKAQVKDKLDKVKSKKEQLKKELKETSKARSKLDSRYKANKEKVRVLEDFIEITKSEIRDTEAEVARVVKEHSSIEDNIKMIKEKYGKDNS